MPLTRLNRLIRKIKAVNGSESGQSVILVSVVILSFLMFFSFAINVGLLITAKISLQNAADAAAYAGAATQARQLNAISYLNYDMRRQYKKFLFRYNFIGAIGSPRFPDMGPNPTDDNYDFPKNDFSQGLPYKRNPIHVPVICIPLTSAGRPNDNCLQLNVPNTSTAVRNAFPGGGLTQITRALLQQIEQIEVTQEKICSGQGQINLFVLINWLFRGDVEKGALTSMMTSMMEGDPNNTVTEADKKSAIDTVEALVQGLGLYPRNIINLMRIETMEGFLNKPPMTDIDVDRVKSLEGSANDAESNERTIQAFKSALSNLNSQVMNPADVTMTELESPAQIKTEQLSATFNAYVQMMSKALPGGTTKCNAAILPFPALGAPVGVKRTNPAITHYAVKLRAKAKLLFLPMKDGIELEAVAAAKPFGSRIGPQIITDKDFVSRKVPSAVPFANPVPINDCVASATECNSPNLPLSGTKSFYTQKFLASLLTIAKGSTGTFGYDGIMKAQYHALSPNPAEVGHYNVLPPAKDQNDLVYEFIPYSEGREKALDSNSISIYRFYAPIFPAGQNNISERVSMLLSTMFQTTSVGNDQFGINPEDMRKNLLATINAYVAKLNSAVGTENQETASFAAIELPMREPAFMTKNKDFWLTEANEVLSSWGPQYTRVDSGDPRFKPRFGYSVKFVTMQNLLANGMADSDGDLGKVSH